MDYTVVNRRRDMCGRFTLAVDKTALSEAFPNVVIAEVLAPRYNIAPTQMVAVVRNIEPYKVELVHWGLVPHWAKDPRIGHKMKNARAESLKDKPSFREPFRKRRCLVLVDGFYEWKKTPAGKVPMYIRLKSGRPFAFAGLWDVWRSGDEEITSCTIVTTASNKLVAEIHDRMPVILAPSDYTLWTDHEDKSPDRLQGLLTPYPAEEMMAYEVSAKVNDPKVDSSECVQPISGR
jgi:putative SOS response-associated peptidase YedK